MDKKIILGMLSFMMTVGEIYGQESRVGINTEDPKATLDIREKSIDELPSGYPQGVSFPNFSKGLRNTFKNVKKGTIIYNTTLERLEIYTTKNGKEGWYPLAILQDVNSLENFDTIEVTGSEVASKQKLMFQDDEAEDILFDENKRGFYINQMLQIKKEGNKLIVRNFLPHTFYDVEVYYKNSKLSEAIKIAELEKVSPLVEFEQDLTFNGGNLRFYGESGNPVVINKKSLDASDYTITLKVKNDDVFNKMQTLKQKTFIKFKSYNAGAWGVTKASHIREYLPILANMAYLYSTERFKTDFFGYPHVLFDNSHNPIDRQLIYDHFLTIKRLNVGVTARVEGLGGGEVFGIHSRMLDNKEFYNIAKPWPFEAWSHELGHVVGFSHASNMTYTEKKTGYGYVVIVKALYVDLMKSGELPFSIYPY